MFPHAGRTVRPSPSRGMGPRELHVRCSARVPSARHQASGRSRRCVWASSPLVTAPAEEKGGGCDACACV